MDTSRDVVVFGDASNPHVDFKTPFIINERTTRPVESHEVEADIIATVRCTAKITASNSDPVLSSWFDIYAALTAVDAMCIRKRYSGNAVGVGEPCMHLHELINTMTNFIKGTHGTLQVELIGGRW